VRAHVDITTQQLTVVSGGGDDKAFFHRTTLGNTTTTMQSQPLSHAHTDSVSAVAWNLPYLAADNASKPKPDPRLVAVGAYDGALCLYDADSGNHVQTLEGPTDVECVAWHNKGGTVLLAGSAADGTLWMYHIPMQYKVLQVFVGHESAVTACAFSPNGKWALSSSSDGTCRIWAPRTGACKHVFRFGNNNHQDGGPPPGLTCLATGGGPEGHLILVGGEDGRAHVCHVGTQKVVATLHHFEPPPTNTTATSTNDDEEMEWPMSVEAVGFSPANPQWCATAGVDGILKIWDLSGTAAQCRQVCPPPVAGDSNEEDTTTTTSGGITRLTWHPTLPLVFTSSTRGAVDLWDARNGQLLTSLTGHTQVLNDLEVQFLEGGNVALVTTASDDETIRVFTVNVAALWNQ